MGKTRDLFKKIRDTKGTFHASSVQFSCSVVSDSLLPCPSPTPGAYSNSCPSSQRCHPTILSSVLYWPWCWERLKQEKGTTEDEMAGWHHRPNAHEFEWSLGVGNGQRGLACCDSWCRKESDTTEWLNWTELKVHCGKFWKRWEYQTTWPVSWEICMWVRKQQLELEMEQQTGSK